MGFFNAKSLVSHLHDHTGANYIYRERNGRSDWLADYAIRHGGQTLFQPGSEAPITEAAW